MVRYSYVYQNKLLLLVANVARLPLEDQYCLSAITDNDFLECLIPTTTGAGALTVSLVDYLILTHNDFMEKCSSKVMEKNQRYIQQCTSYRPAS